MQKHDVVIVGAGAAGLGCGAVLRHLGMSTFVLLERSRIGASFEQWPEETRFITPSFTSNAFGMADLNAIAPSTSPAYSQNVEHLSGKQYAGYLRGVRDYYNLPVEQDVDVERLEQCDGGFRLHTSKGLVESRFVIWATGEFQYPEISSFPGAELCINAAHVGSWSDLGALDRVVIGAGESGAEAAYRLAGQGAQITLVSSTRPWEDQRGPGKPTLAPHTLEQLSRTDSIRQMFAFRVCQVFRNEGGYQIRAENDAFLTTPTQPIVATGYVGGLTQIGDLLDWAEDGAAIVTQIDESTRAPGLFIAGPQVRHADLAFRSIFQFRQRFPVIGQAIARRLRIDTAPLQAYRDARMFLEDLRPCKAVCRC